MNDSIIRTRYADALVKYVRETGNGDSVCAQAERLGEPMHPELARFIDLLLSNGRIGALRFILLNFEERYRRSKGIRKAYLRVAVPPSEELLERLAALVKERTGDEAEIEVEVDPSLIGGFVFDIDDAIIDKSVAHKLELIKLQFIEKNRRIV